MKRLPILGLLLACTAQGAGLSPVCLPHGDVDVPAYLTFRHRTLVDVTNQVVTTCANTGMEVVRQTANSVTCRLLQQTISYTLVRVGDGVRVSWVMTAGSLSNVLVCGVILDAGKGA